MEETTNLKLPLLVPNQSQKEITHNEALVILDNLVNNGVKDKDLTIPPENPSQNDLYIVGVGASGEWEGKDNQLAFYDNGWRFCQARQGTKYWVIDENCIYVFNMTSWSKFSSGGSSGGGEGGGSGATSLSQLDDVSLTSISKDDILKFNGGSFVNSKSLNNLEGVGINCEFDEDNKLMVKSDYVLFDNNGGDSKIKANKSSTTQTASHLFQNNYSGRAEFGLIGNDDFSLKVSSDGSEWKEAFVVDKATGNIDFKGEITKNGESISGGSGGDFQCINEFDIQNETTEIIIKNINDGFKHKIIFENITTNISTSPSIILGYNSGNNFYNDNETYKYNIFQRIATNNAYYSKASNSDSSILLSFDSATALNSNQSYIEIETNAFLNDNKKFLLIKWYSTDTHFRINQIDATTNNNIFADSLKLYLANGGYFTSGKVKYIKF